MWTEVGGHYTDNSEQYSQHKQVRVCNWVDTDAGILSDMAWQMLLALLPPSSC